MNMSEKREYLRFRISLDVDLVGSGPSEPLSATVENFSRQGIGIILKNGRQPKGPEVDLNLHLESQESPIPAKGRITWMESRSGKNHMGVEIQKIDREAKSDILEMAYQKWKAQI